jgi:hypothetical protein
VGERVMKGAGSEVSNEKIMHKSKNVKELDEDKRWLL